MHVVIETFQGMDKRRVVAIAFLCPCVAVVMFVVAAGLTEGDLPRTVIEWVVSTAGSIMVLPAIVLARAIGADDHQILFWVFWLLSGVFWAIVIESFIAAKNACKP